MKFNKTKFIAKTRGGSVARKIVYNVDGDINAPGNLIIRSGNGRLMLIDVDLVKFN